MDVTEIPDPSSEHPIWNQIDNLQMHRLACTLGILAIDAVNPDLAPEPVLRAAVARAKAFFSMANIRGMFEQAINSEKLKNDNIRADEE